MCEYHSIDEYHLCEECISSMVVPQTLDMQAWEFACKRGRKEINHSGGLTRCPVWEER